MVIDDNAGGDRKACLRSQLDIGQDTDAHHNQVCRQMAAIAQTDAGDVLAVALDAGGLDAEVNADARRAVPALEILRDLGGDRSRHHARAKFEDYKKYVSYDGALVFMSGWTGIDFGQYAPTDPVRKVETNAIVSVVDHLVSGDPDKSWTIEQLAIWGGIGGLGPVFVGSPSTIADILQEWVEETDVDGFNLAYAVAHETFADIVGYLIPELQRRGVYPRSYQPGTLREKLFGDGPYLPASHPAAGYRDIEKVKREQRLVLEDARVPAHA